MLVILYARRRPPEDTELHVVGVAAQGKVYVGLRYDFACPVGRIVGEKNGEEIVCTAEATDRLHGIG